MKTVLYLVRHCEAEGNWRRTFQGHTDSEVSEKGRRQLDLLAERFRGVRLDAVYSSPLRRAYETAEAIDRWAKLPIVTDEGLMEIDGGGFEGVRFDELPERFPKEQHDWECHPERFVAPGGEAMAQVFARMRRTIDRIVRANAGKVIAAASHGCAIRNYQCHACGWDLSQLNYVRWCDNTAVSLFEYGDDFVPRIVYLSDASHLPDSASTFATQDWWQHTPQPGDPLPNRRRTAGEPQEKEGQRP